MKGLSHTTINELRQNARSVVRELGLLNDAYFEIGVTLAERHLLIELSTIDSPTMGEIADRLLLDKSTVSRLISNVVKKGYVKCITDDKDKRRRFLKMTEKGQQTLEAFEPIAFTQTKNALCTLSTREVVTVCEGMALYAKGLKEARTAESAPIDHQKNIESYTKIIKRLRQLGYTLDPYDTKDEKELYEIFREVVETGTQFPYESGSKEEFRHQFFTPQGRVYVCHSLKGEVVGGFYLKANYTGRSNHIANAAYMMHSAYRGKGVGSLLIKASLHLAKELGLHAMQFNMVLSQNQLAIQLYKKLGFNIVGIIPQAVRNSDGSFQDGYVMHRRLGDL